jgi:hypothetical protein
MSVGQALAKPSTLVIFVVAKLPCTVLVSRGWALLSISAFGKAWFAMPSVIDSCSETSILMAYIFAGPYLLPVSPMVETYDSHVYPVIWQTDHIVLIDQRQLPDRYIVVSIHRCEDVLRALKLRIVQGSSALGLAAAYGIYLGACEIQTEDSNCLLGTH